MQIKYDVYYIVSEVEQEQTPLHVTVYRLISSSSPVVLLSLQGGPIMI